MYVVAVEACSLRDNHPSQLVSVEALADIDTELAVKELVIHEQAACVRRYGLLLIEADQSHT